jgi:predicted ATP-grasp superfamily ATP-dependent carboligase
LRLLGRAGIPLYSLSAVPSHESRSRWFRPLPRACESLAAGATLAEALEATSLERAVLLPCSDSLVAAVSQLAAPLAARFPSATPQTAAVTQLTSKKKFAMLLDALGVPHPQTLVLDGRGDLESFLAAKGQDLFLKPDHSASFMQQYNTKGCRVCEVSQARAQIARILADGHSVVVQEYLPGPASNHFLIDGFASAKGVIRALFARRRLRMYPADFGDSTHMVSVPLCEVQPAVQMLRTILAGIGYRGIFSAEFKRDARDEQFKILEVNARIWIYVEFAGRCGVDVCAMAYRDALGLPLHEMPVYRSGVRLVSPYHDLLGARAAWSQRQLRKRAWLRSWLGAQQPHFNWTDPVPALREWGQISAGVLRLTLRRTPDEGLSDASGLTGWI